MTYGTRNAKDTMVSYFYFKGSTKHSLPQEAGMHTLKHSWQAKVSQQNRTKQSERVGDAGNVPETWVALAGSHRRSADLLPMMTHPLSEDKQYHREAGNEKKFQLL